jgi:vitamin B12 transporter
LRKDIGTLDLQFSAAYTMARVDGGRSAPQLTGKRPAQAPRLSLSAGLGWQTDSNLSLSLSARYDGDRFEDDLNTRVLPAALSVDGRAEWRLDDRRAVFLAAENLTNADIVVGQTGDGVNSYASPRSLRLGFSVR